MNDPNYHSHLPPVTHPLYPEEITIGAADPDWSDDEGAIDDLIKGRSRAKWRWW